MKTKFSQTLGMIHRDNLAFGINFVMCRFRFGVLSVKSGQTENEIFANVEISPAFDEFLNHLGERIELNGWTKFAGGLDTKSKSQL